MQLCRPADVKALTIQKYDSRTLHKRADHDLDVETFMQKADAKRLPQVSEPMPLLDEEKRKVVEKWADRAMQASGLDPQGIQEQVQYYKAKGAAARMEGKRGDKMKADNKRAQWEKLGRILPSADVDMITPMREKAARKLNHHRQALEAVEHKTYSHPIDREVDERNHARNLEKWQGREVGLQDGNVEQAVMRAAEVADEYHQRRIRGAWNEDYYHKQVDRQKSHWHRGDMSELESDHRIRKERATDKWIKWRAVARQQQRKQHASSSRV